MRIVILGCAGSGKTTLAKRLSERTGAPLINLDEIWQTTERRTHSSASERSGPQGKSQTKSAILPEFRKIVQQAHAGEAWISDGNFSQATFDLRLPRATQILWLERSKLFCVRNAVTRLLKPGESHRIKSLLKVLKFIWNFDRINRPRIEKLKSTYGPNIPTCVLRNDRAVTDFLDASHP